MKLILLRQLVGSLANENEEEDQDLILVNAKLMTQLLHLHKFHKNQELSFHQDKEH
jgi:hypothetical protein